MQRPTRITVFGILCLVIGGVVLLNNLNQLGVAVGGPEAVEVPDAGEAPGMMGQMLRETMVALRDALEQPVYRTLLGIKSLASTLMAGLLIFVGIGLLREQLWAIRYAKVWAVYAIAAAVLVVVLQSVYVVPKSPAALQSSDAMAGMHYVGSGLTLVLMCIFPLLLLFVLPRPHVIAYLGGSSSSSAVMPMVTDTPVASRAMPAPRVEDAPRSDRPQQSTWRDDPWNDASSQ